MYGLRCLLEIVLFPIATSDVALVAATVALATATLAVALAATRSALLSARQMKRSFLPITIPGRPDGITRDVTFINADKHVRLENAETYTDQDEEYVYLAFLHATLAQGLQSSGRLTRNRSRKTLRNSLLTNYRRYRGS